MKVYAPKPCETDGEARHPGPGLNRPRKRGPRSPNATEKRLIKHRIGWAQNVAKARNNTSYSDSIIESVTELDAQHISLWHCNVQSFHTHNAELAARIRLAKSQPDIVCLNETNLQHCTEHVELEGYVVAARRDRKDGRKGGGSWFLLGLASQKQSHALRNVSTVNDSGSLFILAWGLYFLGAGTAHQTPELRASNL